jgi:TPR repeat protein
VRRTAQAVEAGDPEAMFDMGRLVEERDGVQASERWFRMAAEHGQIGNFRHGNLLSRPVR